MESNHCGKVQARRQQQFDRQQQPRLDGRSPTEGSTQCQRKELQLLPSNEIVACSDTNATDGDGLRTSPAEFLYGRPTSSSLVEAGIEKNACWGKLRRGNKRPNSASQSSTLLPESLKWGAKKVRTAAQSSPADDISLVVLDGNGLITPANSDCERNSQLNLGGKRPRPRARHALRLTRIQDNDGNSCIPKMISSESTPMVARMETWSTAPPPLPLGPITPVPNVQKRPQKRKSLQSLIDVHDVRPNVGSEQECMLETPSPAGSRMLEAHSGSLSVVLPVRRELFSSRKQKVAPTLSRAAESPTAPEKVHVQAGEWAGLVLECGFEANQIRRAVAGCNRMLVWNRLSADMESVSCYGTEYPNGVHIVEDVVTHIQQPQSSDYLLDAISPSAAQDNGRSYQLKGNDVSDIATIPSSDPSTPLKFSISQRPRQKSKDRTRTDFSCIGGEDVSTGCLRGEGAVRTFQNAETEFFSQNSRRGPQKACFDLNKPASQVNEERPDFLTEKPPDSDQKVSRKKHRRPRVLKDVTKPVRVPKPKKAATVRKPRSTKPKKKKNTGSQDAQMRQPDVSASYDCYEEQVETRVFEQLPGDDSLEASPKPLRMRAAARSSKFSLQTLEDESIVAVGIGDLQLVTLNSALVVHSSAKRAIVPYAKPRVKPFKPKVQLENDDLQWWKLVMTHGPSYQDKNDEATAEKWARERFVFSGRAEKFIQVMHEVQGNRRFSKWKGSVIDSVVGAFLTQNVSDHLSSSAFMLLASRFPLNIFREVEVEETFEPMESHTDASLLTTRDTVTKYLVEFAEESTTAEEHTGEESSVAIPSTVEELEKEHAEFWTPEQSPEQSIQHGQTLMETQHQADHTGSNDVSGERSRRFKILGELESEDGNPSKSSLLQNVEDNDASVCDGHAVSAVENPLVDEVQNTIASQISSDRLSSIQLPSASASSVEAKVMKISYNGLTGSERARMEENKTKSKDKVDWEKVRKSHPEKLYEVVSPSSLEDAVDWEAVRISDVHEIASVIKERGMNNMLAGRIKGFLNRLQTYHGSLSLEWLRNLPPEEAKKFLLSIHGLGLKSVECIRLLTLHHLAFPVDTNVGRICVRLGWVPIEPLPEVQLLSELETYPVQANIQKYLWPRLCTLDQRTLYELHYQMITFGKVFCTKRDPNCNACPLRNDCKHYADSVSRSKRLEIASTSHCEPSTSHPERLALPAAAELVKAANQHNFKCEPIIEEPKSPARDSGAREEELVERTVPETSMQSHEEPSHALVIVSPDVAAKPVPKLKRVGRLRTVHYVYELKDDHPLIELIGARVADDPCPVLLAIWGPGESPDTDVTSNDDSQQNQMPETVLDKEDTVKGTLLVPCRTANRGNFPLNGTYFQVNEVFADHETSINPIDVPRRLLWNLTRRFVYFGTSVTSIFKGLTVNEISHAFHSGYVCVRGFDSVTRAPKPLQPRLHSTASFANKRKQKQQEKPENNEEDDYVNKASDEVEPNEKKQSQKVAEKTVV